MSTHSAIREKNSGLQFRWVPCWLHFFGSGHARLNPASSSSGSNYLQEQYNTISLPMISWFNSLTITLRSSTRITHCFIGRLLREPFARTCITLMEGLPPSSCLYVQLALGGATTLGCFWMCSSVRDTQPDGIISIRLRILLSA